MAKFIVDANIIVEVLRGNGELASFVKSLDSAIDTTIYVELIQGAKNKIEVARIERSIKQFPLLHFSESISLLTIDLIRRYSKSHGLMFGDAVIAATCLEHQIGLVTFNAKDFRFIEGLRLNIPKL